VLKAAGYVFRRIRQTLRSKRDQIAVERAYKELLRLHALERSGKLVIGYLDEVGFSLQSVVPYGWQRPESQLGCQTGSHHRRINAIGLLQVNCEFDSYIFEESITGDVVVACIDRFIEHLRKETDLPIVIVLDNASIHTKPLEPHLKRWKKQGVRLKYLPKYSPELNIIEILWRHIKYYWLPLNATESWEKLVAAVEDVLSQIGEKYQITFA
jgi:transposase